MKERNHSVSVFTSYIWLIAFILFADVAPNQRTCSYSATPERTQPCFFFGSCNLYMLLICVTCSVTSKDLQWCLILHGFIWFSLVWLCETLRVSTEAVNPPIPIRPNAHTLHGGMMSWACLILRPQIAVFSGYWMQHLGPSYSRYLMRRTWFMPTWLNTQKQSLDIHT